MNVTAASSPSIRYWLYALEGMILVPSNGIIFLTIIYHRVLRDRKEFTLLGALAFIDAAEGYAVLVAGLGRNWLIMNGRGHLMVSRRHCMLQPWNWAWLFTMQVNDATLLAISIDRLIAVAWPLFHYGLTTGYSKCMLACAWCPGIAGLAYTIHKTLEETEPTLHIFCFTSQIYPDSYLSFLFSARVLLSTTSVLLYILIIVLHWRQGKQQLASQGPQFKQYLKNERKLTVTLGLSCVFTTIFYVLPLVSRLVASYLDLMQTQLASTLVPYSTLAENINRMFNILLYSLRHKNIRYGVQSLVACKQLNLTASGQIVNKQRVQPKPPSPTQNA